MAIANRAKGSLSALVQIIAETPSIHSISPVQLLLAIVEQSHECKGGVLLSSRYPTLFVVPSSQAASLDCVDFFVGKPHRPPAVKAREHKVPTSLEHLVTHNVLDLLGFQLGLG